jgi:hypothetical protein
VYFTPQLVGKNGTRIGRIKPIRRITITTILIR